MFSWNLSQRARRLRRALRPCGPRSGLTVTCQLSAVGKLCYSLLEWTDEWGPFPALSQRL